MSSIDTTSGYGRVLIATASVGAGHKSVAETLAAALSLARPQLKVNVVDVLDFAPWLFRAYYAGGFALAMTRAPRLYGLGFALTNRPDRPRRGLMERRRLATEQWALRRFARYIRRNRFDLIVNTHFVAAPLVGGLIRRGLTDTRQIVTVTDIEVHRFWYAEGVHRWFVPADYSARQLRRWGIADDLVTISGIPIHPKWTAPLDRADILRRWNLPADKTIIVLTGGTEFTCGPVAKIARRLLDARGDTCIVVLAGRNKKLLATLATMPQAGGRLFPVGFTDRVHELVEVCSIMITKAGGLTTAECLAKAKPMVLLRPVPGHEAGNAAYLAGRGAAVLTHSVDDVTASVSRLLDDPAQLARIGESAGRLHRPATETITAAICRMVSSPAAPEGESPARASGSSP